MKKFLVIGNPIDHSLSPKLHNYWINNNNINAIYEKQKLNENELEQVILQIRNKKISGVNVTVPFKKTVIPYLDELSHESQKTQSVNTIYLKDNKVVGHNTDIVGFETSIKKSEYDPNNKEVLILGAGGVVPSIIFALIKMKVSKIKICNRTKEKAENLKKIYKNIEIIDWGETLNFDMIINATSLGLKETDNLNLNFSSVTRNKFFYDVIYNPSETNFLKMGRELGNKTLNGKLMFIYQALSAFNIWHNQKPEINENVIQLLD
ncbi:shikimate dehydrogenase [Candidatus Pelagibacter sp.]|jgi:shikimate dehydrogenase|nr:shikimate dehydrogenase [Candidatus Pelagibacter bacterium]MDB3970566.1 shikimate dehydrogenase [Candidatus Pelagibacter sp.]